MKLWLPVAILLLVPAWIILPSLSFAEESKEVLRLTQLRIEGATDQQIETIRTKMTLKKPSWQEKLPWKKLPAYSDEDLEDDIERIRRLFQYWGFYEPKITSRIDKVREKKTVSVVITIEPGPPTLVASIKISEMENISAESKEAIRSKVRLSPGKVFNQENYEKSRQDILDYLGDHGFARALVNWKVVIHKQKREADVSISITAGERYRFGKVSVEGLKNIDPKVVISQMIFKEGEVYSATKVKLSQRKVYNLGCFNLVTITPLEPDPRQPDLLPLKISTKPKKERAVIFGIGWGAEDQFRAKLGWENRNFLGQARYLSVQAKYSSIVESLDASFKQPYFFRGDQYLAESLGYRKDKLVSFSNEQLYNQVMVTRILSKNLFFGIGHGMEYNNPEHVEVDTPFEQSQRGQRYFISAAKMSLKYDTRDNVLNPTKGFLCTADAEVASTAIGSKIGYVRLTSEARRFIPLSHNLILACRLTLDTIQATENEDEPPIFKRFFSGGSNSVRGYAFQKLGPRDENGNPIGGDTLLEGSLELRFPVWKDIGGAAFFDFGHVNSSPFSLNFNDIRYTSGVGVRYNTPIGPLRADIGYQLNPQFSSDTPYQVYISIGHAF